MLAVAGGRRNFFQHGELPLVLLALIARRPVHGYELMAELDRLLRPSYQPSPGSVYPALAALVGEGMLADENDGEPGHRRRTYRITRKGRAVLAHRRPTLRAFEVRTGVRLGTDLVRDVLDRFATRVEGIAERVEPDDLEAILDRAATELEAKRLRQRPDRRTSRGR